MTATEKAQVLLSKQSTKDLIAQFELTETVNDSNVYIVRGWIMDELEKRNPEAFDKWIDSEEDSPRKFF